MPVCGAEKGVFRSACCVAGVKSVRALGDGFKLCVRSTRSDGSLLLQEGARLLQMPPVQIHGRRDAGAAGALQHCPLPGAREHYGQRRRGRPCRPHRQGGAQGGPQGLQSARSGL